jgi:hypothetical protein
MVGTARPQAIALEVPACLMPELAWAARSRPVPVASVSRHPVDACQRLLHQATRLWPLRGRVARSAPAVEEPRAGVMDVARTAVYARNLAATRGLRELASLCRELRPESEHCRRVCPR